MEATTIEAFNLRKEVAYNGINYLREEKLIARVTFRRLEEELYVRGMRRRKPGRIAPKLRWDHRGPVARMETPKTSEQLIAERDAARAKIEALRSQTDDAHAEYAKIAGVYQAARAKIDDLRSQTNDAWAAFEDADRKLKARERNNGTQDS